MKRLLLFALFFFAVTASTRSMAADAYGAMKDGLPTTGIWTESSCNPWVDFNCTLSPAQISAYKAAAENGGPCDPYIDYSCLDKYLGDDPFTRFVRYYELEWGKGTAPSDPHAPASSRPDSEIPPTPESSPPMPFTEWPYGGTQNIGKTLPNAVDSPLMVAIANTSFGQWLNSQHVQIYGWVDPAGNVSTNTVKPAGNLPISYDYTPNTIQLDQAVVYIERLPNEVQNDQFDWGFRVSGLYGVDGRYTMAYGLFSNQLFANQTNIYDMPMMYADLYFPVVDGLNVRIGRFISVPDIEAQLAPNNYTYVHSLTYTWDNYTNTGIQFTLAMSKNWILQLGTTIGTEAMPWHWGERVPNYYVLSGSNAAGFGPGVDPLYPGTSMLKDPGAVPSLTTGIRWTSDDGRDDLNLVADAWDGGQWGYNNLQWIGGTYYHKLNDYWHFAFESWNIHEYNVPNSNNPAVAALFSNNGTPFSPVFMPFNGPNLAQCGNATALTCTTDEQTFLLYVNYSPNRLNNFSLRTEFFDDPEGQRTGVATRYADAAFSWQHWFSPQVEVRPEIGYYRSLDAPAFNGNLAAGILPNKDWAVIAASDIILHF
jgi:Putative beta-barrel porin-2, OmpL-like. bbp2